jgi:glycosyltransferase involved in cell wall biosynthesis
LIVAFDTLMLSEKYRGVGIYQYAKNLFLEFGKLTAANDAVTLRYFVTKGYSETFLIDARFPGLRPAETRLIKWETLWRMGLANLAAGEIHADLIFSPSPRIFPLGTPAVVTIHDVMASKLPTEFFGKRTALALTAESWIAAKRASKIITVSHHSKKDIVEICSIDPSKISVVYNGYDAGCFNTKPVDAEQQKALLSRLGIHRPYIIHHGMVQSRKNLLRLIRAYKILMELWKGEFELVLAGSFGYGSEEIRTEAATVKQGKVVFTGTLSDEDLGTLLKGASLAVIPSLYEGFCLPIIESMASGIPTIGADNSCIPEVSGNALRYFDATSEDDMISVMHDVLSSSDLRNQLRLAGIQRSSEFSWERCARETLSVLAGASMDPRKV